MIDKCPFTGLPCYENKIIQVTELDSMGSFKTYHLCERCGVPFMNKHLPQSQSIEEKPPEKNMLYDLLQLMFHIIKSKNQPTPKENIRKCPDCHATLEDIKASGKIGCITCYEFYKNEMRPIINQTQKSIHHVGKRPKHFIDHKPLQEQINILDLQLRQAVDQEQYERAKEIKDKLEALKMQLGYQGDT